MAPTRRTILFALAALLALGPAVVYAKGKKRDGTDGQYKTTVAGTYKGSGTATVSATKLTIIAQITDQSGRKGQFTLDLPLDGPHFRGAGTAMGQTVKITGRLDGYADSKNFRGARVLGTYSNGPVTGRFAGVIE